MLLLRSRKDSSPFMLVFFWRNCCTTRSPVFIGSRHYRSLPKRDFIPISQSQQRKLLEWRLVSVLDGCNDFEQIKQVLAHIFRKRLNQRCYVLTKLIRMLTKLRVPVDSYPRLLFEQVSQRNPFLWSAFVHGYTLQGPLYESFLLYNSMRSEGTFPVSFTFSALLKACTAALDIDAGRQLHAQAIFLGGFASNLYVGNTLINMYVKCGSFHCGHCMFDEMPQKDVISWTSLIVAYARSGDMDAASGLFNGLPEKDSVAWTAMVTGYAQNARPRDALLFFELMQGAGIRTDEVTLVGVISACGQLGAARYGRWVEKAAEHSGFWPSENVVVGSALVDMYSKCGPIDEARRVFMSLREKNVFSYSSMILGFATHGYVSEAFHLFREMSEMGTKPNAVTFIGLLTACSHTGKVEDGWRLFATMEECYGVSPSVDHYTCMVDLLGRAGRLREALELVKLMSLEPHGGVWGALLGACRIHGNPEIAEIAATHLFEIEPDDPGNYLLLSNIYASGGRWMDVARVRRLMRLKGLKKNPACSWVEAERGEMHGFFEGDVRHPRSSEIRQVLEELVDRLKAHGYRPRLSSVVHDVSDEEKERILLSHSEKLALGFGLLLGRDTGSTITIVKNFRLCEDCHLFMCGASSLTGTLILVRDNMRFHHFGDGRCSCNNFW